MPTPWRPPGLGELATLGLSFGIEGGVLEEERVAWAPTYRIIASEYAGESLFDRLTSDADYVRLQEEAEALREIADLTNPYVQGEAGRLDLVRPEDWIHGPGSGLVMASFAHPSRPCRFSDGTAGAYYTARELPTAIAETCHHAERALVGSGPFVTEKTVVEAELDGTFVDLRRGRACPAGIYDPDDYSAGQALGRIVRQLDGHGIVYDSVRHPEGECVAAFRPPVLRNARAVRTLHYHWDGSRISEVR